MCFVILEENSLPPDIFARNFLPSLLHLGADPVPNVRLSLSKVMALRIMPLGMNSEYFDVYLQFKPNMPIWHTVCP